MKKQAGFTLIELVMVIVILGILSAVALPKFVNLGSDARTAAMKAVEGSMRSTNAMIYAKASVNNKLGATGSLTAVQITGGPIATKFGFASEVVQLRKAMDLSPEFATSGATIIQHNGAPTPTKCKVTYAPATSATALPTYTSVTTGC